MPAGLAQPLTPTQRPWRRIALALGALLLLNGLLSFSTWWPTPAILPDARIAPEFVLLWLAMLALVAWRGSLGGILLGVLTLVYMLLVLGRYADVTAPAIFGREIRFYWDGPQIPRFLWVWAQDKPWWLVLGAATVLIGCFAGLYGMLRALIRTAAREAVPYALRARWTWVLSVGATVLIIANYAGVRATWPVVSKPVIPVFWHQAGLLVASLSEEAKARLLPAQSAVEAAIARGPSQALAGLAGRDVYLIMLESIGAVTYDDPRAHRTLAPVRERFKADLEEAGLQVVSGFFRSPTFGGGSDLAQLGVLAGMDLSNPTAHDVLLTTQRPTLVSLFRQAGYQSFGFYPGLRWEWPERSFYDFEVFLENRDLGYQGPKLGYWEIPDQYAAARFEQLHPRKAGSRPRFVFFPLITCHLPFSPPPPYQPDWARVLSPEPYDAAEVARALAEKPHWTDMFPDYLRMVQYTYQWLGPWLGRAQPRETVFVLAGDHQPVAGVTGQGASWDVPVHVVSRDPQLLARFIAQGFAPGMAPPRRSLGRLDQLTGMMLEAFGP